MNATTALSTTAAAGLPAAGQQQMGFADLLGISANPAIVAANVNGKDKNKATVIKGTKYCLLPISAKEGKKSIKSEFNLTGSAAKARHALELHNFSTRAFAGVSGAIASGKMLMSSVVVKDSGRMTVTLVPNGSVVVQAPVDLAAVEAYLKAHPDDAKLLLGN